jgi:flagellar protein FlaJ
MNLKELLNKISFTLKFWSKPKEEVPEPSKPIEEKEERLKPVEKKEGSKPWVFAYHLVGGMVGRLISLSIVRGIFGSLEKALMQSRLKISFKAYVSLIMLSSTIVFLATIFTSTVIFLQFLKMNFLITFLLGIATSIAMASVTGLILYLYPKTAASSLKTKIDSNMPFATSYMAVLSSAGVAPSKMFKSLMVADGMEGFSDESRIIVRNIDIFGEDVLTGVENVARESVSSKLRNMLEGYVTTIRTGGDVQNYLTIQAKQSIDDKRMAVKRFIDSLTIVSEMYVTLVIVAPIVTAIILSIMAVIGGVIQIDPLTLIYAMAFLFIPVANFFIIIFVDMMTPELKG